MNPLLGRKCVGSLFLLAAGLGLSVPVVRAREAPDGTKKTGPVPSAVRVTPSEASGAVEVSVAINPTNPDHLVAVSIARMKDHPGITDFAYVSNDAGRTWKMVPRANPHRTQQGDDAGWRAGPFSRCGRHHSRHRRSR